MRDMKGKLRYILEMSKCNHKKEIIKQPDIKYAHIYCKVNRLSGQISGPLVEYFIQNKYGMVKNKSSLCLGDLNYTGNSRTLRGLVGQRTPSFGGSSRCLRKLKSRPLRGGSALCNLEIKISNGGITNNRFNYVQLRMNHECDYLLTAYYIDNENLEDLGELYIFKLDKKQLRQIIYRYGGYAHGTVKKLGIITIDDLEDSLNSKEYAIRPKYGDSCWEELLNFRIDDLNID
jgi:hypothetical protein